MRALIGQRENPLGLQQKTKKSGFCSSFFFFMRFPGVSLQESCLFLGTFPATFLTHTPWRLFAHPLSRHAE